MKIKKSNPSGGMEIALIGGAGLLVWWWLSHQSTAAATTTTTTTAPTTTTQPPATTPTGAPVPPQNPNPPAVQVTGGGKLGTIYQNLQNAISSGVGAGDPAISGTGPSAMATPYVWNYYLALSSVNGNAFTSAPDVATVFAGQDMSKPMALSTYWAGMAPALTAKYGLSGLRGMGAAIPQSPYFNRVMGGWLA